MVSYGACGMPYVIEGLIHDFSRLIARPAERFKHKYNIDIIENTRVVKGLTKKVYAEILNPMDTQKKYFIKASSID